MLALQTSLSGDRARRRSSGQKNLKKGFLRTGSPMSPEDTFRSLIERVRASEPDAATELAQMFEPFIRRYARFAMRSAAITARSARLGTSDICQSVLASLFVRLKEGRFELHDPEQLEGLLRVMSRFKIATEGRKLSVILRELLDGDSPPDQTDPGPSPEKRVDDQDLADAILKHFADEEIDLLQRRLDGKTWPEIAEALSTNEDAARKKLTRAIERVRRIPSVRADCPTDPDQPANPSGEPSAMNKSGSTNADDRAWLDGVLDEQSACWHRGESPPAEEFFARFPALESDTEAAIDVIYQEYVLRRGLGESPAPAEFIRRFPAVSDLLVRQFAADDVMHRAEAETEPPNVGESDQPDHVRGRFTVENHRGPADITTVPSFPGYQCLAVIGHGGMGVVYKAVDTRLRRVVVLKTITELQKLTPNQLDRFLDEAHAAARLQHPNIITVHAVGDHDGRPYFGWSLSMAAISRSSLPTSRCRRARPRSWSRRSPRRCTPPTRRPSSIAT